MQALIWLGAAVTVAGVGCLFWCVRLALKARREAVDDADMRRRLQRVVTLNLAALGISALGLMLVVTGVLLG
jgi:hypothetical protein